MLHSFFFLFFLANRILSIERNSDTLSLDTVMNRLVSQKKEICSVHRYKSSEMNLFIRCNPENPQEKEQHSSQKLSSQTLTQ